MAKRKATPKKQEQATEEFDLSFLKGKQLGFWFETETKRIGIRIKIENIIQETRDEDIPF